MYLENTQTPYDGAWYVRNGPTGLPFHPLYFGDTKVYAKLFVCFHLRDGNNSLDGESKLLLLPLPCPRYVLDHRAPVADTGSAVNP